RPPGADVVDVAVAVEVIEVGAGRAVDERGRAADGTEGPHRAIDPARQIALGLGERLRRSSHGHRVFPLHRWWPGSLPLPPYVSTVSAAAYPASSASQRAASLA